jgi:hypothetical protein
VKGVANDLNELGYDSKIQAGLGTPYYCNKRIVTISETVVV